MTLARGNLNFGSWRRPLRPPRRHSSRTYRRRRRHRQHIHLTAMSATSSPLVQQRLVPGAPPPAPAAKTQKKKRKPAAKSDDGTHVEVPDPISASQIETAPSTDDVKDGSVAPQLLAKPEDIPEATTPIQDGTQKTSLLVEMVNKRMKATNKKIVCSLISYVE